MPQPAKAKSAPGAPARQRIAKRLSNPNILAEIVKSGLSLSGKAQADFIGVLETVSTSIRELLLEAELIKSIQINHADAWAKVKGLRLGFVDGGVANVAALGAAPVAIRVGSYTVIPGETGPEREAFDFEVTLVDELYQSAGSGSGIYDDLFEDPAKLRDAARIACEMGGVLALLAKSPSPDAIFLHGPLVNPVSPYALGVPGQSDAFPNFTQGTLTKLLPDERTNRTGRDANFIAVYRAQLERMQDSGKTVCGVVERAASAAPGILSKTLLKLLETSNFIDATSQRKIYDTLGGYSIGDTVLFECVLEEGEYVKPVEVDKQQKSKIPGAWEIEIEGYPKPHVTFVKAHAEAMPLRVECFANGKLNIDSTVQLVLHMSRLLPRYSFPVGLDIADKHAKVPEWMSRQMNTMLSAQLMRKALESGNPATIRLVKRILCSNMRDWLFRPDFQKGN